MGLDMYLDKMPRYKDATADDVIMVENYLDWEEAKQTGSEHANCTFKQWCGREIDLNSNRVNDLLDFYAPFYEKKYPAWDTEKKYGYAHIIDQVGYWRKANHIHNWFVENIQDGEDECRYYREVTKEDLEELLDACEQVLSNPNLAPEMLPTQGGFFFGSTEYDEWYMNNICNTIDIITRVLETTDFDSEMLYYRSSW